jgi:hypothetical protein
MSRSDWVYLDGCDISYETDKAMLIIYDGDKIWIPKSQIGELDRLQVGDTGITVLVSRWFAEKEGIEGETA